MADSLNRRMFLSTSGLSLALPLLDSMKSASGAEPDPAPPRIVLICTALGLHSPSLFPRAPGPDYESTEYLRLLGEHRSDFTLFSGLSHPDQGGEHATEMTWLSAARNPGQDGFRNSISIDQFAAGQFGYVTRYPSVSLSSAGPGSQSYTGSGVMVPAEHSPAEVFAKMFLQGNPQEVQRQKQKLSEGRSILDEVLSQTKAVIQSAGAADKHRLQEYFMAVRQAEQDLAAAQAWHARPKPTTTEKQPTDIPDKADLIGRTRLLLNLIPLILQTDSSRVISVMIQDHQAVPVVPGVTSEHHNLSHHGQDPVRIGQLKKIETALINCFGNLLGQLKQKSEGAGSLLDSTSVLFGSNLGNANAHDPRNLPVLLAGGPYRHGRYVSFDRDHNTPLCNLFLRMLQTAGVEAESFGSSTGTLTW